MCVLNKAAEKLCNELWDIKVLLVKPKNWHSNLLVSRRVLQYRNNVAGSFYGEMATKLRNIDTKNPIAVTTRQFQDIIKFRQGYDSLLLMDRDPILLEAKQKFVIAMMVFIDVGISYFNEYEANSNG